MEGSWHRPESAVEVLGVTNASEAQSLLYKGVPHYAGFLTKLGGVSLGINALKRLQRRFFVLRGPYLQYFASPEEAEGMGTAPKGQYLLHGASVERATAAKGINMSKWPHVLQLHVTSPAPKVRACLLVCVPWRPRLPS